MNAQKKICAAFCEGLSVREIPLGYAIKTPFSWLHGEPLVVFGERSDGLVRMRDGGDTLALLEDVAGDLTTDTKMDAMRQLATEHGIAFDEENSLFLSDWTDEADLGSAAVRFMSFLNRIQDLAFLSRDRISNAFREELTEAIKERFGSQFHVGEREALSKDHKEYTADIIIRDAKIQAAVYAATSEVNVLEALLTEQVFRDDYEVKTVPVVVFEDFMQSKVKPKTRRRAMNSSGIEIADWAGGADEVLAKISQILKT
ncbi:MULTISPECIES: DUF1828 domain-containing protein [Limimaricola]|jgi:hypothetical protein|uniref:DUF1828 domain-containing protein n=1 Tax=Limimaricola cinnabarinus TaxID=1125964 RepID=A0A2G1MBL9_9RHOB|nr:MULTISPECIES: DUF1828 domain-containing protein [Limimaricola]MCZ4262887.1 DUF1828 domain-containing protein [Limimaricola sp. G21655-S1]PHP26129.1 hypothetical protein CJ301_18095 [Limimaricola cinnabarinus]